MIISISYQRGLIKKLLNIITILK